MYIINGAIATAVHYSVLYFNVELVKLNSVGISNFVAAFFGISASFIGNRFFVFSDKKGKILKQIKSFALLYFSIAFMHGLFLYLWADLYGMDYRIGFVLVTILQVLLSYIGNKKMVFK